MLGAISSTRQFDAISQPAPMAPNFEKSGDKDKLHGAFNSFVGETFYGQMLKSLRQTQEKPAYFHGGRAEEVFQQQLDQVLVEKLTEKSAHSFSDSMFDLFQLQRS